MHNSIQANKVAWWQDTLDVARPARTYTGQNRVVLCTINQNNKIAFQLKTDQRRTVYGLSDIKLFGSCDLDLDLMTLIYEFHLYYSTLRPAKLGEGWVRYMRE